MRIEFDDSGKELPEEEDIYGVNDMDEYDPDYWMPNEYRRYRQRMMVRAVAFILAVAFFFVVAAGAVLLLFFL